MIGYIEWLVNLSFISDYKLAIDFMLKYLPKSQANFIMNFNMSEKKKTLEELLYVLRTIEKEVNKTTINDVLLVDAKVLKAKGKDKTKCNTLSKSNTFQREMSLIIPYEHTFISKTLK